MRITGQEVAHEGVLEGYALGRGAKLMENLNKFVGITVPVTLEHPVNSKGQPAFVEEVENPDIVGTAKIYKCPHSNAICADLDILKGTPVPGGYSIGYGLDLIPEKGVLNGEPYDFIQSINEINHIALTSMPRDERAIVVADSTGSGETVREFYMRELHIKHKRGTRGEFLADSAGDENEVGEVEENPEEREEGDQAEEEEEEMDMASEVSEMKGMLSALIEMVKPTEGDQAEEEEETEGDSVQVKNLREELEAMTKRAQEAEERLAKIEADSIKREEDEIKAKLKSLDVSDEIMADSNLVQLKKYLEIAKSRPKVQGSIPAPEEEADSASNRPIVDVQDPTNYRVNPETGKTELITAEAE